MSANYFRQAEAAENAMLTMPCPSQFGAVQELGVWYFPTHEQGQAYHRALNEWQRDVQGTIPP